MLYYGCYGSSYGDKDGMITLLFIALETIRREKGKLISINIQLRIHEPCILKPKGPNEIFEATEYLSWIPNLGHDD